MLKQEDSTAHVTDSEGACVWYSVKMSRRAGCDLLCFSRWLPASKASQGPDCHWLGSETQLLWEAQALGHQTLRPRCCASAKAPGHLTSAKFGRKN